MSQGSFDESVQNESREVDFPDTTYHHSDEKTQWHSQLIHKLFLFADEWTASDR